MHPRTIIGRALENLDLVAPIALVALVSFILWGIW